MSMRIYLEDPNTGGPDENNFISVPDFDFGDAQEPVRGQTTRKSVYGHVSVTDRGYVNRAVAGLMTGITCQQMYDLEDFVKDTLKQSLYRFFLRRENKRADAVWNRNDIPFRINATIGGSPVKVDDTLDGSPIKADQRIPADYEWIGPCRLNTNGLKRTELAPGGNFNVSISATKEFE